MKLLYIMGNWGTIWWGGRGFGLKRFLEVGHLWILQLGPLEIRRKLPSGVTDADRREAAQYHYGHRRH